MADSETDVDVVIAGAGAAGCFYAARLAAAGKSVLVLEAGPPWQLTDLVSSQLWARRLKWGGAPVLSAGRNPFSHNFATGWGFGGAALHHYAGWPRLLREDFSVHSDHGRARDWPFAYDALRPHYDRIQTEIGIAGDAELEIWRPPGAPYPMPPLKRTQQGEILSKGFKAAGLHVAFTPMAINSVPYNGRPACVYDGWCDAGCPILALANPLVTHLPEAEQAGARFVPYATVTRVLTGADGRATGLAYADRDGAIRSVSARLVVLAMSAIQNPRLMLASASARHPRGLANGSDLVGRYFFCHTINNVYGMFPFDVDNHIGLSGGHYFSLDRYAKNAPGRPYGSLFWGFAHALKPNDIMGIATARADLWGEPLHAFMRTASRRLSSIVAIGESTPQFDNRVELADATDSFGTPLARVVHSFDPDALALWERANAEGETILNGAGAGEIWHGPLVTAHLLGGTVMGADPAGAVTDGYGIAHGAGNVIVAGSGLYPSGGAVSPTFTIYAIAQRSVDHLLANWNDIAA